MEETDLNNLEYLPFDYQNPNLPLDIDTHFIPQNPKKAKKLIIIMIFVTALSHQILTI